MWIIPNNISHYVQDTEELISDLDELSQNLEQSVMWRSKPSQASTWHKRLKKGGWIQHLSGRTLRPSHSNSFTEKWTSSLADSHVNPSPMQEKKQEQTTNGTSGLTSNRAYEIWGSLPLFSLKTSKGSSQPRSEIKVFSTMSSSDWSKWVTKRRQEYSVRVKSVEAINESECLLWVCSMESKSPVLAKNVYWPIPQKEEESSMSGNPRGKLNPRWVELLMGVPIGWTSPSCTHHVIIEWTKSECLETESSQTHVQEPSDSSPKNWPTVRAVESEGNVETWQKTRKKKKNCGPTLSVAVKMWSTPNTLDHMSLRSDEALMRRVTTIRKGRSSPSNLREQVNTDYSQKWKMWSTPLVQDHKRRGPNSKQQGLPNEISDND